jgi:hypothetical protein
VYYLLQQPLLQYRLKGGMPGLTNDSPASEEITIDEAMALTGKSRDTLMRWKARGKVTARTVETEYTQRQRRILFRRSEIEALAGPKEG